MNAKDLIENEIEPISMDHSVGSVLNRMTELRLLHLPVVRESEFLGLLDKKDLVAEGIERDQQLKDLQLELIKASVNQDQHFYDLLEVLNEFELTLAAVLDNESFYAGAVSLERAFREFVQSASVKEPGGIIVLRVDKPDYTMAQIAQIIESNDARILSTYLTSKPENNFLDVTVKVNSADIDGILQTLRRYEYTVLSAFQETYYEQELKDKYDELMNYINM